MHDPGPDLLIKDIRRTLLWLTIATVVVYVALIAAVVIGGLVLSDLASRTHAGAEKDRKALCVLRGDLQKRVDASVKFLVDHPRGVAGIPAKTILDGIDNQRRTIRALSGIDC